MSNHNVNMSMIHDELIKLNLLLKYDIDPDKNKKDGLVIANRLIKGETVYNLSLREKDEYYSLNQYDNKKQVFKAIVTMLVYFQSMDKILLGDK